MLNVGMNLMLLALEMDLLLVLISLMLTCDWTLVLVLVMDLTTVMRASELRLKLVVLALHVWMPCVVVLMKLVFAGLPALRMTWTLAVLQGMTVMPVVVLMTVVELMHMLATTLSLMPASEMELKQDLMAQHVLTATSVPARLLLLGMQLMPAVTLMLVRMLICEMRLTWEHLSMVRTLRPVRTLSSELRPVTDVVMLHVLLMTVMLKRMRVSDVSPLMPLVV